MLYMLGALDVEADDGNADIAVGAAGWAQAEVTSPLVRAAPAPTPTVLRKVRRCMRLKEFSVVAMDRANER